MRRLRISEPGGAVLTARTLRLEGFVYTVVQNDTTLMVTIKVWTTVNIFFYY